MLAKLFVKMTVKIRVDNYLKNKIHLGLIYIESDINVVKF